MRTTSLVEAINSIIQRSFPSKPHWFRFIEHLRLFESVKSTDLFQISSDEITNPKLRQTRAKDKRRCEQIESLNGKLERGEIDAAGFLEEMCDNYVPPAKDVQPARPASSLVAKKTPRKATTAGSSAQKEAQEQEMEVDVDGESMNVTGFFSIFMTLCIFS